VKGDFEFELGALHVHMMEKVQVILVPFLAFKSSYNASKAHNMLAIMLDFEFVDVMKVFVRLAKMIQIIVEYDSKTLLPLLVVSFHFLNPTCCNPSFGLATKAKGVARFRAKKKGAREPRQRRRKGADQKGARESHHILPGM
jgi:hypothetical protein